MNGFSKVETSPKDTLGTFLSTSSSHQSLLFYITHTIHIAQGPSWALSIREKLITGKMFSRSTRVHTIHFHPPPRSISIPQMAPPPAILSSYHSVLFLYSSLFLSTTARCLQASRGVLYRCTHNHFQFSAIETHLYTPI